ncbi:uncharacterized protein DNG_02749 [Cephalotrichum gorgonifer]|uniref:Uncharacterized protein n=1 Tax=Cephalotrichum gorgonifer TaxID=2041049 RepID=A0AAE8MV27_9PEZI|nr:uncharacterized protein DNG_02749 [Cephalotrichum gorgonifer]
MALWPFRRKSGRKRSRSGTTIPDSEGLAYGGRTSQSRSRTANYAPVHQRETLKKRRTEPTSAANLPRRRNSFSPGRPDSINASRWHRDAGLDPWMRPNGDRAYERVGDDIMWSEAPTLGRRKSSKRRKTDHGREVEIKAMTNFTPIRSATDTMTFSRPTRTTNKRTKTGPLGRSWENTPSDVSLPTVGSLRSGMSSDSDHAFRVTALASLAPRPTLRYVTSPRWTSASPHPPSRTTSQKRKISERPSIPNNEQLKSRERINDLADDLDASDIRELMERDKRRREKKISRDQARAERKLARMAEERRIAQTKASQEGLPPPPHLDRGVAGRELAGSDVDTTSAVVTSSKRRQAGPNQQRQEESRGDQPIPGTEPQGQTGGPLGEFHRTNSIPLETITPQQDADEVPATEVYSPPSPTSSILRKLSKPKKSTSKSSSEASRSKSTISPSPGRNEGSRASNHSEGLRKVRLSLLSLVRWTRRNRHGSGPSSFSNTSREEMQAAVQSQAATAMTPVPPTVSATDSGVAMVPARRLSTGVPKRTRSRFREDLPELPLSPPESRMASPETPTIPEDPDMQQMASQVNPIHEDNSVSTPTGHPVDEAMRHTPVSQHDGSYGPSPEPHSISLASIDSEASWLSGRIGGGKQRSIGSRQTLRERANSHATSTSSTEEDHGVVEDEYLARLTPARLMRTMGSQRQRISTGDALPSSDEDEPMNDADVTWGAVKARRQPAMVHASSRPHTHSIMSHDGLIASFDEELRGEAEEWVEPEVMFGVQRATSVNLGKNNARRISAGSDRLLEIAPRVSTDSKRRSTCDPEIV